MRRRNIRPLGLLALLAAAGCGGEAESPPAPPNVVIIISDDHGWPDYGFMGHEVIQTPNLDRLASESMVYTRGYVPAPVCRPSLATIATGLYPHQHQITGNDPPGDTPRATRTPEARASMERVFARNENVMQLLARSGYASHQSGKWWEGNPLDHGFTAAMTHGDVTRGGRHGDDGLTIGREGMDPIFEFVRHSVEGAPAHDQNSVEPAPKPFFIWYAPFLPHTPHNPPERLLEKYSAPDRPERVASYYAMVDWFDETVGELLDFLDGKGPWPSGEGSAPDDASLAALRNTVVLYVADNGWLPTEHRRDQAVARAKMSPYELGVRTPIMIRWPGRVEPGRDDRTLVSSIDLVPTILDAVGIEPSQSLPGISLLEAEALPQRKQLFGSTSAHTSVDVLDPAANLKYRTVVREDGWKLILPHEPNREVTLLIRGDIPDWMHFEPELYNVIDDPFETKNLAAENPEIVAELQDALREWWLVPGDPVDGAGD